MISIENLQKSFGSTRALDGVSLTVEQGELFAYLGPNGCGKTTTVRILAGLCRPDAGTATVAGYDVANQSLAARMACGLVSQHLSLDLDLTVSENLEVHGRLFRLPRSERPLRTRELLSLFELEGKADMPVKTLSGGQKRRVMMARGLMHRPRVLFLDEPTIGLDPAIRRRLWGLIRKVQKRGTTIFLTTHYIEEAEHLADRVALLDAGRIVRTGTPQSLIAELGEWVLDEFDGQPSSSRFFPSREEAECAVPRDRGGFTLRRISLEDAFLAWTGKKLNP